MHRVIFALGLMVSLCAGAVAGEEKTVLSLPDAVSRAVSVSRQVKQARHDVDLQTVMKLKDFAYMSPKVTFNYSDTLFKPPIIVQNSMFGPNPITIRPEELKVGSMTIAQPLSAMIGFMLQARVDALKEGASKSLLESSKRDVAFAAAAVYRQVQLVSKKHEIAKRRLENALRQQEDAKVHFELGRMTKRDMLRLGLLVGKAKVELVATKAEVEMTEAAFWEALDYRGKTHFELETLKDGSALIEFEIPALEEAQRMAMKNRPEIDAARLSKEAMGEGAWFSIAPLLPDVNGFFKVEHYFNNPGSLSVPTTKTAGFTVNWPIWDGGLNLLNTRMASIGRSKARLAWVEAQRKISLEVQQKRAELLAIKETFLLQKEAYAQAEESYKAANELFSLGSSTVTEFLLSEEALNTAKVDLAKALNDFDVKNMALQKAMGQPLPSTIL